METTETKDLYALMRIVKKIKFFKERNLNYDDLLEVWQQLEIEEIKAGKDVFKYGYYGDSFYIILKGSVSVLIPKKKPKVVKESNNSLLKSVLEKKGTIMLSDKSVK